ncbi:hypothetical protein [Paenibacillus contaminans]|uniref:hypothetical protein n=1 Tax=Paenibacillus contaminans TaxID=450362 RepID=UPI001EDCA1B0|nr:hypothetical protein [Paenibacillus contaminans]
MNKSKASIALAVSLLAAAISAGCGNGEGLTVKEPAATGASQPASETPAADNNEELLQKLQVIASQAKNAKEVTAYLDSNISEADKATADRMFMAMESFVESFLPGLNASFSAMLAKPGNAETFRGLGYPPDLSKIPNDDPLKEWFANQFAAKFMLDEHEGDPF